MNMQITFRIVDEATLEALDEAMTTQRGQTPCKRSR